MGEEGEIETANHESSPIPEVFYDKTKSFFDCISCEATEKSKGGTRGGRDRNAEKNLNKETFGVSGNRGRGFGYRRGGGYSGQYRGGYNNYGGRGGFNNQSGGYIGYNGRFARDGNNFRGGRGRGYGGRGQRGASGARGNWESRLRQK